MATQYDNLINNVKVRKMLDLIANAEGVKYGYNTLFGNQKIDSLTNHPNIKKTFRQTDGKTNYTTAAGRYQFIKPTWDKLVKQYGLSDFSPQSQDIGAIALLAQNGSLPYVLKGDYQTAVKKSGGTWASLPSSTYAQPRRAWDFVNKELGTSTPEPSRYLSQDQVSKVLPQLSSNNSRYLSQDQIKSVLPQLNSSRQSNRYLSKDQIAQILPQLARG